MEMPSSYNGSAEKARMKKSDDASAAIAAKLLQGWALLNDYCPQCFTPLVRNREGRMYCVGCSQWVITENAAAEILENPSNKSHNPENAATVSEPIAEDGDMGNAQQRMKVSFPAQQIQTDTRIIELSSCTRLNGDSFDPANMPVNSNIAILPNVISQAGVGEIIRNNDGSQSYEEPGKEKSLVKFKVDLPSNTSAVLSQTLANLFQKIEEMSKLVAVTHEPLLIKQYLEIIEHCIRVTQQITTLCNM